MVPNTHCCQTPENKIILRESTGLISNYMTQSSGCGGTDCPWVLKAPQGQMINISLFDFNTYQTVSKIITNLVPNNVYCNHSFAGILSQWWDKPHLCCKNLANNILSTYIYIYIYTSLSFIIVKAVIVCAVSTSALEWVLFFVDVELDRHFKITSYIDCNH